MLSHPDCRTTRAASTLSNRAFRPLSQLSRRYGSFAASLDRRLGWLRGAMTPRKSWNLALAVGEMLAGRCKVLSRPVFARIDVSPGCNLHCTVCVHAEANGDPALLAQDLHPTHRMSLDSFQRIVDQLKPWAAGVSLYYLGDPLIHPDIGSMCAVARAAGLNVHYSTNFSFRFSDARIREIITSGLTHLTVCVDGLSQATYGLTRIGGRIDRVLENLRRACAFRRDLRQKQPFIEVQYIKYQHNLHELDRAKALFRSLGVDQVHELWGGLHNYTDRDPGRYSVFGPLPARFAPRCHWPYLFIQVKYDGDVIPCCCFRLGQQYVPGANPRAVGNLLRDDLAAVWNSDEYQRVRRLVTRPESVLADGTLDANFCYACPRLFRTDYSERTSRFGDRYRIEDCFDLDPSGRPLRRPVLAVADRGASRTPAAQIGCDGKAST
ncbi:MAG: SPASM domain-containing protein [Planctomycetes bacterium]|nr:SPASM domain-containing protein [Planctomycetota bacterium]